MEHGPGLLKYAKVALLYPTSSLNAQSFIFRASAGSAANSQLFPSFAYPRSSPISPKSYRRLILHFTPLRPPNPTYPRNKQDLSRSKHNASLTLRYASSHCVTPRCLTSRIRRSLPRHYRCVRHSSRTYRHGHIHFTHRHLRLCLRWIGERCEDRQGQEG